MLHEDATPAIIYESALKGPVVAGRAAWAQKLCHFTTHSREEPFRKDKTVPNQAQNWHFGCVSLKCERKLKTAF